MNTIKNRYTGKVIFKYKGELNNVNLTWVDLFEADLTGVNLSYVNLTVANLSYADLSYTNLSYTNLSGADLTGANLTGANLYRTDLIKTNLSGADLTGANLTGANLSKAKLDKANLSGANLYRTYLIETNLKDTIFNIKAPKIENIHKVIYEAALKEGGFNMLQWHCGTTHCRGGLAVHLAGEAGYELEAKTSTLLAGKLIYEASTGEFFDTNKFFADNDEALEDMRVAANG